MILWCCELLFELKNNFEVEDMSQSVIGGSIFAQFLTLRLFLSF